MVIPPGKMERLFRHGQDEVQRRVCIMKIIFSCMEEAFPGWLSRPNNTAAFKSCAALEVTLSFSEVRSWSVPSATAFALRESSEDVSWRANH